MALDSTTRQQYADPAGFNTYSKYQERYVENIRESDKVILNLVGDILQRNSTASLTLLDIGCSTGNLLAHLQKAFPKLKLCGGDFAETIVDSCKNNKKFSSIEFQVLDMLVLPTDRKFDVVVANAVAVHFDNDDYERAIANVASVLNSGGTYLAFEWLHPFEQHLEIVERSPALPITGEVKFHFRPYSTVRKIMEKYGFAEIEFLPFEIPIDLTRNDGIESYQSLTTYTRRTETGERLQFRGILNQPWCHLKARRL